MVSACLIDSLPLAAAQQVARELLPVKLESEELELRLEGFVSNANYHVAKHEFILFINNRLVQAT